MNALTELGQMLDSMNIAWQTGSFQAPAPNEYIVFVPLGDIFDVMADNRPTSDIQMVRVSIFSNGNYNRIKDELVRRLLSSDFYFSDRRYMGYDSDTGYHQYVLDIAKHYEMEGL